MGCTPGRQPAIRPPEDPETARPAPVVAGRGGDHVVMAVAVDVEQRRPWGEGVEAVRLVPSGYARGVQIDGLLPARPLAPARTRLVLTVAPTRTRLVLTVAATPGPGQQGEPALAAVLLRVATTRSGRPSALTSPTAGEAPKPSSPCGSPGTPGPD